MIIKVVEEIDKRCVVWKNDPLFVLKDCGNVNEFIFTEFFGVGNLNPVYRFA